MGMSKMPFRSILLLLICLIFTQADLYCQTPAQAMERIRTSSPEKYKWGMADADTEEAAKGAAMENLLMSLRTTLSLERKEKERLADDGYKSEQISELRAQSIATVENLATISFQDEKGWHYMYYVSADDLKKAEEARRNHISDIILLGIEQEGKLNIAGALKYYSWALSMLNAYGDQLKLTLEGREQDPRPWLQQHIPMMMDNISVKIDDTNISYDELDYDHYTVNLNLDYAGKPVSALDLSYFNGEREIKPVHAKNGTASLHFPELANFKEIAMKIVYDYPEEGKIYDKELAAIYNGGHGVKFDHQASIRVPIKVNSKKLTVETTKSKQENLSSDYATAPIIKADRKEIERPVVENEVLVSHMEKVTTALRNRNYESVKSLFTDEGWSIFKLMTSSGELKVVKKAPSYTIESTQLFTIGKGIPVSVKNGRHISNENIVFRFDKDSGLIKSVAYALTAKAENDIFRQAQWNMESRYSLLTFMEDYQTAFALKRLDYIRSIFSDDAVIITGKFADRQSKQLFHDIKSFAPENRKVKYTRYNKEEYLDRLEKDFFDKSSQSYRKYIQLVFEDAVLSKVATGGFVDNDVMWIEIKQHYISDKYSDTGYLALQINLKPTGSRIHVRTWTPYFMEIDDLKQRFNVGF